MLLIFEGPDNGGKSTICKLLTEQCEVNFDKFIRHHSPWQMLARVTDTLAYPEKRNWDEGVTVLDRWHYPSDVVNEPVHTGNTSILEPLLSEIEFKLKELNTHIIYIDASWSTIEERYNRRGDEFVGLEQIKELQRRYKTFMYFRTGLPVYTLLTDDRTPQECVDVLIEKFGLKRKGR